MRRGAESAADKYGSLANGAPVKDENSGDIETRSCLTTRNDGRIRILANNETDWKVRYSGPGYVDQGYEALRSG